MNFRSVRRVRSALSATLQVIADAQEVRLQARAYLRCANGDHDLLERSLDEVGMIAIAAPQDAVERGINDPVEPIVELSTEPGLAALNRVDQRFVVGPARGRGVSATRDGPQPFSDANHTHLNISTADHRQKAPTDKNT